MALELRLNVYERYIAREVITITVFIMLGLVCLFSFFDLIHELGDMGKHQYLVRRVLVFVVFLIPQHVVELMPLAVLIGAIFSLSKLARQSELTVLRASGLSSVSLLGTLAKLGFIFALITVVLSEWIVPSLQLFAKNARAQNQSEFIVKSFRSGVWMKDGKSFIKVGNVNEAFELESLVIFEFSDLLQLRRTTEAKKAIFSPPDNWLLSEVTVRNFSKEKITSYSHSERNWHSSLNPDILSALRVKPDQMTMLQLYSYSKYLKNNKQDSQPYIIAAWHKLLAPLSIFVMLFLALPFALLPTRGANLGLKVFVGIIIGITFHLINSVFSSLSLLRSWSPFITSALPVTIFFIAAMIMLWKVERR